MRRSASLNAAVHAFLTSSTLLHTTLVTRETSAFSRPLVSSVGTFGVDESDVDDDGKCYTRCARSARLIASPVLVMGSLGGGGG